MSNKGNKLYVGRCSFWAENIVKLFCSLEKYEVLSIFHVSLWFFSKIKIK